MRRLPLALPLAAGLALVVACSSTTGGGGPTSTTTTAPSTGAPATSPTSTVGPATTARSSATTRSSATSGTAGSASVSTDGACGWLTLDEVEQATGEQVTGASVVRGGCRWSNGSTPVVDVEVDSSADAVDSFRAEKAIYADASVALPDIGDDRYWAGLDDKLVFLRGGTGYTVWIQTSDDDGQIQPATIALARAVEQHA